MEASTPPIPEMLFEKLIQSHQDEIGFLEEKMKEEPENEIYRRLLIRSIFSNLEIISSGLIEYSKPYVIPKLLEKISKNRDQNSSSSLNDYKILFTICAADDKSYKIDDKGEVVVDKLKVSSKDRLLFSLKLLFESRNQTVNPKEIEGWNEFSDAIKIRDRVTHPKSLEDIKVSKENHQVVMKAFTWVLRCIWYGNEKNF